MKQKSQKPQPLPATDLLDFDRDFADEMVAGISRYLRRALQASVSRRSRHWHRDYTSYAGYEQSIEKNRRQFRQIIGLADDRVAVYLQRVADIPTRQKTDLGSGKRPGYTVNAVRWTVLKGVDGEGLLLVPNGSPIADVIALPDCDHTPEMLAGRSYGLPPQAQFARRLVENGCRVLIPMLVDRQDRYSGVPWLAKTNQPHREFIYRAAFPLGRHIIGYEVQKTLAAVDWFMQQQDSHRPVGVIGYGEGGLVAMYAAAADPRIGAAAICGYFCQREQLWQEPIYRNVFGLLEQFGDAEIASMIAPRSLYIEASPHPQVAGPPPATDTRSGAAPGILRTPSFENVEEEFQRAKTLISALTPEPELTLIKNNDGPPGSDSLLQIFLNGLGMKDRIKSSGEKPAIHGASVDPDTRVQRQFTQLLDHTQHLLAEAEFHRKDFWVTRKMQHKEVGRRVKCRDDHVQQKWPRGDDRNTVAWQKKSQWYRKYYWKEIIGRLPAPRMPIRPRTRQIYDEPSYRGYEVMLDVYPDVFAYGILLVPKDLDSGEKRPVVVCQHGLEGTPQHVADLEVHDPCYNQYACRLAERGFITYAPQNPYRGGDTFRMLQRMANPLKWSIFSFIVRQHERTLTWLASLPFVDPALIAFYGLSYGGMAAMRVPAILEQYCLSISSANYSDWLSKVVSVQSPYSYMFSSEWEMPEFNIGPTFNYAELSWLICPRPFMVERGHQDPVGPDEWLASEFAKTRQTYVLLGLEDRTEIEYFNGGHTIHGEGSFRFLEQHLQWPEK